MGGSDVPRRPAGYWQLQFLAFQHSVRKQLSAPCPATLLHPARLLPADFTLWVFRWGADFLLASAEQAPASLVAAVGDSDVDHSFWDAAPLQVDIITRTSRAAINVRSSFPRMTRVVLTFHLHTLIMRFQSGMVSTAG